MKKLMALILTAALAFGSSVVVLAEEDAVAEDAVAVEEVVTAVNVPFTGTSSEFVNSIGLVIGTLPAFADNAALTNSIRLFATETYVVMSDNNQLPVDFANLFAFQVEESLTAARVEVTVLDLNLQPVVIATYYLDKATNTEITAAAFADSLLAEEAVAEEAEENGEEVENGEEEVAEAVMVPLRANAEAAGFTVEWNRELAMVTVTTEEDNFSLAAGSVFVVNSEGEQIELETAPVNIDGTLYVPLSFFTVVLGISLDVAPLPAPAPVVEDVEEEEEVEYEEEEEVEEEVEEELEDEVEDEEETEENDEEEEVEEV